jgi:hypothetical protein
MLTAVQGLYLPAVNVPDDRRFGHQLLELSRVDAGDRQIKAGNGHSINQTLIKASQGTPRSQSGFCYLPGHIFNFLKEADNAADWSRVLLP